MGYEKAVALDPSRHYQATPEAIGIKYKTYKIKVNDSVSLNSWVCLQKNRKKPFIIISNTDAGNMSNSLGQAQALYQEGYNVILYDYRGFGESSDFDINSDKMYYNEFSEDLNKTIEFVNTRFKPKSIVLYGLSMGTIISRMNMDNSKIIKGLILDSFVIDPKLVVDRIFTLKNKEVLLPDSASGYAHSNMLLLKKPVLIFSGLKDYVTVTADYKEFLSKNPIAKMVTSDGGHLECFTSMGTEPNLYISEVNQFIDTYCLNSPF
ncbi:alpha/beta hydrolase [Pedobacter antarcticus]|uniref:alpha/beta hydrolase n=1 Tax=Pedobacter antarcticus TaxID=34086 RepID=UPI0029316FED|nr:alpha/beta fold hydrolase [Pedobacter antarcticus]